MRKLRVLSLTMAAMLCLSLFAACGSDNGSGSQTSENPAAGGGNEATENASLNGEPIKVGLLAPLTGEVAQYGVAVRNGAKLYVDEYNAAGGLNGRPIELIEYDEEGDTSKAITGYNYLMDQEITALIGSVTTAPTLAVVPEANADNLPMITASATAAAVTVNEVTGEVYDNVFRSCFIDPFQGEKMAAFASDKLDAKTAAVLFNTGSDYSIGLKDAFLEKADELGLEVVATEGYSDGAVDFQSQLTNMASKNPDVLFVPDYYETVGLVAPQARNAGLEAVLLGGDGWDSVLNVVSDLSTIEGSFYCSGYSTDDPDEAVQAFLAAYRAAYGEEPNMFAAQAYDAAAILIAGLEEAEAANLETGSEEYKQAVIDAMKATDMDCVTGHVVYNAQNNPEKSAVIINIQDGQAAFWGTY